MSIVSLLGYRHYRLEAEINSMTWKIYWKDIQPCDPSSKQRGSIHSLHKRGSQLVNKCCCLITLDFALCILIHRL